MPRRSFRIVKKSGSFKKRRGAIGKKSKAQRKRGSRRRIKMIRGGEVGKIMLLIIDPQQDFVDNNVSYGDMPIHIGTLTVPNASADLNRVVSMLNKNPTAFDEIHVSLDTHTTTHIAHAGFWDAAEPLEMYTALTAEGTINAPIFKANGEQVITPKNTKLNTAAYRYLTELVTKSIASNGTIPAPLIWKNHCLYKDNDISPTEGWKLYKPLADVLSSKKFSGKVFFHEKGTNDLVEMYSIFSSEIPFDQVVVGDDELAIIKEIHPEYINSQVPRPNEKVNVLNEKRNYNTDFNKDLFDRLMGSDGKNKVFVCGEAKSHCVKTSLEDMVKNCDGKTVKASQIYALQDMMSPIATFEDSTATAFAALAKKGVNIINSNEISKLIPANYLRQTAASTAKIRDKVV